MRNAMAWMLVFLVAAMGAATAEKVELAAGGEAKATIVVAPDAHGKVVAAAEDLQHYVKKICGVELPIARDGKAVAEGTGVYIGQCAPAKASDLPRETITPETFAVRVRGGDIYLTGRAWHARMFAVYDLLENDLGVRWYAPTERWEAVPKGTAGALTVDVTPREVEPDWSPRIWSGHAWTKEWQRWLDRNKAQSYEPIVFRNFQNYVFRIFPPEKYAKDHPEYYPLVKGKRWIPPKASYRYWRPCESNPDVQRIVIEHAREYLDKHPEHNSFSLGMDDVVHMCGCEKCRAWDPSPDSHKNRDFSARHYQFVNIVARALAKSHPDKFVGTLCYAIARELPEGMGDLEPNVFITMTQRSADWWRPGREKADKDLTRGWAAHVKHFNRYDYIGLGYLTPRVFPHALARAMEYDKRFNFHGMYTEDYDLLPTTAPMMWMMAKLQWDTSRDPDGLLKRFYKDMFGRASETMQAYYETLERGWNDARPDRVASARWGHRDLVSQSMALPLRELDAAEALIGKARAEAKDAVVKHRIEAAAAALRYGSYPVRLKGMSQRLAKMRIESVEDALSVFSDMKEMARLSGERAAYWPEALKRDDLFGDSLRGLKKKGYFVVDQISRVEGGGGMALVAAVEYLQKHAPDRLEQAIAELGENNSLAELARAAVKVATDGPPNLLKNPGFEDTRANKAKAERDWSTEGAPAGWSTWSSGGVPVAFGVDAKAGRDGSKAATIQGPVNGCFIQSFDVVPGEKYVFQMWARREPADAATGCTMKVRWRTAKGWFEKGTKDVSVSLPGDASGWQKLAMLAKVPEGATRVSLLLLANPNGGEGRILMDDVSVQRVP